MAGPPPGGVIAVTPWHRVQLDNTRPDAEITIDAGACELYVPGTLLTGHFVARDPHFGHFTLDTLPSHIDGVPTPDPTTATPSTSQTSLPPGDAWELDTADMTPCGYVVRVRVWDRSIRGSSPGHHNYNTDEKGFCLLEGE